jgi:hypothetical protein
MPGPYEQLADPNALAAAGQAAQSPEFWRALMAQQQPPDRLIPPPQVPTAAAGPATYSALQQVPEALGIPDAMKALRGQMTPTEAQDFAMQAAIGLLPMKAAPLVKRGLKAAEAVFEPAVRGLDMSEAARMARAKEMGLTTDAYHGTKEDYSEFKLFDSPMADRALGTHFAKDPGISNSFVISETPKIMSLSHDLPEDALPGGRVIPARIPAEDKFLQVPQPRYEWAKPDTPDWKAAQTDQNAVEILAAKAAYQRDPALFGRYISESRMVPLEEANKAARDMLAGKTAKFYDNKEYTLDRFLQNFGGNPYNIEDRNLLVATARKAFQEQGYEGLRYINTAPGEMANAKDPTSYIVFDPARSRSRFAAFDPAKRNSRDLLAGIAGAGAVGGLAASQQDNR